MYLNSFSVRVVGGKEVSGGYVECEHGKSYSLVLKNDRSERCDARLEIDGKHEGTWRIEAHSSITLERPAHDKGKFTFYKIGTQEAEQAALDAGDPNLGLVKVTFTPEMKVRPLCTQPNPWSGFPWQSDSPWRIDPFPIPQVERYYTLSIAPFSSNTSSNASVPVAESCASSALYAGGTGLSGQSSQEFGTAFSVFYDYSQQSVIHLRLVAKSEDTVRPLTVYSTPIPPAIR